MLVTSRSSAVLYSVDPASLTFTGTTTGFRLFLARSAGGVRFATSLQDGVLMEPVSPSIVADQPGKAAPAIKREDAAKGVHPALPH
jgi:hypothetical protein